MVSNLSAVISFYAAFNLHVIFVHCLTSSVLFSSTEAELLQIRLPLVSWQTLPSLPHNMTPLYPQRAKIAFVCFIARSHITFSSNFSSVFSISFLNSIQISLQVFPIHCISVLCTAPDNVLRSILFYFLPTAIAFRSFYVILCSH